MRLGMVFMAICLTGCAVTEQQYPQAWEPLPVSKAQDCARFAGTYADRGEATGDLAEPSLTYGLFGHHSAWKEARRVDFMFPTQEVLYVTAWDEAKPLFTRILTAKAGEFQCQDGRLVVRSRRWVAADVVAGREDVTIEFSQTPSGLVAYVKESTYGAIFAVVPIAGTASHWYRFARLDR
jgi:hypothetical protein